MNTWQIKLLDWSIRFLRMQAMGGNMDTYAHAIHTTRKKGYDKPKSHVKGLEITLTHVEDCPVYTITPIQSARNRRVMYLHGGAYVLPITKFHWALIYELALNSGCTFTVPLYPLAPESTVHKTLAFALNVYQSLLLKDDAPPVLMGDSAGGGLALALMQQLPTHALPIADRAILISPWVDISMTHPDISTIAPRDPMLSQAAAAEAGQQYAGVLSTKDVRVSPIYAQSYHLPKCTTIFTAGNDMLTPDITLMCEQASAQGHALNIIHEPKMFHCWPELPNVLCPLAKPAKKQMIAQLTKF